MKNKNSRISSWKKIWNNRKIVLKNNNSVLAKLMTLNGHSYSINDIKENNWKKYGENISLKLDIKKNESIFEYGCGSGALLFLFKSKTKSLFGCDYSKELVNASKKIAPQLKIFLSEGEKYHSSKTYDYIISSSMLEYVKLNKAKKIIKKMTNSFNKGVFIGEILDKKFEKIFLKKFNKPRDYYTFIDKKYFENFCKKNKLKLKIYPSILPGSKQTKFRYCVQINR